MPCLGDSYTVLLNPPLKVTISSSLETELGPLPALIEVRIEEGSSPTNVSETTVCVVLFTGDRVDFTFSTMYHYPFGGHPFVFSHILGCLFTGDFFSNSLLPLLCPVCGLHSGYTVISILCTPIFCLSIWFPYPQYCSGRLCYHFPFE